MAILGTDILCGDRMRRVPADARIPGVQSLGQLVTLAASRWPDRTAWRFDVTGETLSFSEIEQVTRYLAGELSIAGIGAGDRVVLLARNTLEFPATK